MRVSLSLGPRDEPIAETDDPHARVTFTIDGDRFDVQIESGQLVVRGRDSSIVVVPVVANVVTLCAPEHFK